MKLSTNGKLTAYQLVLAGLLAALWVMMYFYGIRRITDAGILIMTFFTLLGVCAILVVQYVKSANK